MLGLEVGEEAHSYLQQGQAEPSHYELPSSILPNTVEVYRSHQHPGRRVPLTCKGYMEVEASETVWVHVFHFFSSSCPLLGSLFQAV